MCFAPFYLATEKRTIKTLLCDTFDRLPTSIGYSVRFNWTRITGESQQFIHTNTTEALPLPLSTV